MNGKNGQAYASVTTPATITTGTYAGDNNANRAIAHGFSTAPRWVFIQGTNTDWLTGEIFNTAFIWDRDGTSGFGLAVTAPDATNFYVGNAGNYSHSQNLSTRNYTWIAISY